LQNDQTKLYIARLKGRTHWTFRETKKTKKELVMKTYLGVLDKVFGGTLLVVAISTVNTIAQMI